MRRNNSERDGEGRRGQSSLPREEVEEGGEGGEGGWLGRSDDSV